jgi:hypothetical protein
LKEEEEKKKQNAEQMAATIACTLTLKPKNEILSLQFFFFF